MEKLIQLGKTRAIGVSNFTLEKVDRLLKNCKIPPAVNQVIVIILRLLLVAMIFDTQIFRLNYIPIWPNPI